jgi:hypothetical protein
VLEIYLVVLGECLVVSLEVVKKAPEQQPQGNFMNQPPPVYAPVQPMQQESNKFSQ